MTDKEAISNLKELKKDVRMRAIPHIADIILESLDMAIKALEQQPKTETHGSTYGGVSWGGAYKPQQPCEDCISRAEMERIVGAEFVDLQDGNEEWRNYVNDVCLSILENVHNLPSVTPKTRWIPVSEEPKETGTYITTIKYGDIYAVGQRYYHGKYIGWEDSCVIAYMPLPQPYAESEDKE